MKRLPRPLRYALWCVGAVVGLVLIVIGAIGLWIDELVSGDL